MNMPARYLNKNHGFTIIELIVVIVVMAIIAAMAVPSFTGYLNQQNSRSIVADGERIRDGLQTLVALEYGQGNQHPQAGNITPPGTTEFDHKGYFYGGATSNPDGPITPPGIPGINVPNPSVATALGDASGGQTFYAGLTQKGLDELSLRTGIRIDPIDSYNPLTSSNLSLASPWAISVWPGGLDQINSIEVTYFVYQKAGKMIIYDPTGGWYGAVKGSASFPNINKSLARDGDFSYCNVADYKADQWPAAIWPS